MDYEYQIAELPGREYEVLGADDEAVEVGLDKLELIDFLNEQDESGFILVREGALGREADEVVSIEDLLDEIV